MEALSTDFVNTVPVFSGLDATQADAPTGLVAVDQSRAIAEVQAGIVVAQMRPRDENGAYLRIIKSCKRKTLAEQATYAFPRGGKMVTGPSIRLAEEIARHWGNITYGLRELNRRNGTSEVEAFAWDLETNTRVTRQFQMNHIRDTKQGPKAITDERDIYEYVASMGQRRVRACILEIIPGDIVDAAESECRKTLESGGGVPLEDRIRAMLAAFDAFGVTKAMVEKRIGHPVTSIIPQELVTLQQVYQSIKDGIAKRESFFDLFAAAEPENTQPATATAAKATRTRTTKPKHDAVDFDAWMTEFDPADVARYIKLCAQAEKVNETVVKSQAMKDIDGFKVSLRAWLEANPVVTTMSEEEIAEIQAREIAGNPETTALDYGGIERLPNQKDESTCTMEQMAQVDALAKASGFTGGELTILMKREMGIQRMVNLKYGQIPELVAKIKAAKSA